VRVHDRNPNDHVLPPVETHFLFTKPYIMSRNILTLLLLICCLFTTGLHAQSTIGLRVLSGASSLTSPEDVLPDAIGEHTSVSGTTFGLVVERAFTHSIGLRTGLQMTQRGTTLQRGRVPKLLGAEVPIDYEAQIRMSYLEVPLALRLELPVADQIRLYGSRAVFVRGLPPASTSSYRPRNSI